VNIGLVVFTATGLDIRVSATPSILNYFGVSQRAVDWISTRIRDLDDPSLPTPERAKQIARAAGYSISEIGWFSVDTETQYETRVSNIITEYVERPKRASINKARTSISKNLRKIFKEYSIFSTSIRDIDKHMVVSNVPVGPSGKLHVDFVLKNSKYHATETIDFSSSDNAGIAEIKNAALASVTFQHTKEAWSDFGVRCYLVYAASLSVEKSILPALKIARHDADDVFNLESSDEKSRYIDIILQASGNRSMFDPR